MHTFWVLAALAVSGTTGSGIRQRQASLSSSSPVSYTPGPSISSGQTYSARPTPSSEPPASSGAPPSGSSAAPLASSARIQWPASVSPLASPGPCPISNQEQVGSSVWGSISARTFPKWIDTPDGKPYKSAPWGDCTTKNCNAYVKSTIPVTNVTRRYDFVVSRGIASPDGVKRNVILINGQFPGPLIHANWGDYIEVTVHNNIQEPEEGTSLHWHGSLQLDSVWEDGVAGVSQCPIAPGASYTYKFQAQQFGSSMYHAHYSAQYTAGVVGPIQVYGPSQLDYDIDLGPVMLSDWFHIPYFSVVQNVMTQNLTISPPLANSGLINGRGRFDCSNPSYGANTTMWLASDVPSNLTWTCVDGADRAKFRFQSGKVHRLRVGNIGADGIHKFSIDGHQMTVIANDYVPIEPYTTDVLTLAVGQRADVLVTANGSPDSSYWMRSEILDAATCGGLAPPGTNNIPVLAAVYYEKADTTADPTTTTTNLNPDCNNEALAVTRPEYVQTPSTLPFYQDLVLTVAPNATGSYEWLINGQTFRGDYNNPLLYDAAEGITDFPANPEYNVYNFASNTSVILNITNGTPFPHPIHLHGHDFYVLSVGGVGAPWDGSAVNSASPMRRDTQILPALGYIAIQFEGDNPGVWPLHCHVAWHLSAGWYINVMSMPDQLGEIPAGQRSATCDAWDKWTNHDVVDQIDSGS